MAGNFKNKPPSGRRGGQRGSVPAATLSRTEPVAREVITSVIRGTPCGGEGVSSPSPPLVANPPKKKRRRIANPSVEEGRSPPKHHLGGAVEKGAVAPEPPRGEALGPNTGPREGQNTRSRKEVLTMGLRAAATISRMRIALPSEEDPGVTLGESCREAGDTIVEVIEALQHLYRADVAAAPPIEELADLSRQVRELRREMEALREALSGRPPPEGVGGKVKGGAGPPSSGDTPGGVVKGGGESGVGPKRHLKRPVVPASDVGRSASLGKPKGLANDAKEKGKEARRQPPPRPRGAGPRPLVKEDEWAVVGRKGRKGGAQAAQARERADARKVKRPTVPRTAAVTITAIGAGTYASLLKEARERVSLPEIEVDRLAVKRARNGGMILEVPGADCHAKADLLARSLEEVLCGGAKIARPCKRAELRVVGLDDSVTPEEVVRVLREVGGGPEAIYQTGEIRRDASGLGAMWVRCPLTSALKLVEGRTLKIGWSTARVRLLEERPSQCYKCWGFGHLAAACRVLRDHKGCCFRCGGQDHPARECGRKPMCTLCRDGGLRPDHRMGSRACPSLARAVGRRFPPSKKRMKEGENVQRQGGSRGALKPTAPPARRGREPGARDKGGPPPPTVIRAEVEANPSRVPGMPKPLVVAAQEGRMGPSGGEARDVPLPRRDPRIRAQALAVAESRPPPSCEYTQTEDAGEPRIPEATEWSPVLQEPGVLEIDMDWDDPELTPMGRPSP